MTTSGPAEDVNYVAAAVTLLILVTRLVLWLFRRERIDASFGLVVASILVVVARIVTNVYYLRYGNAFDATRHDIDYFDASNARDVHTGSVLVLVARVLVTAILWLQVCILLLFYSRITYGIHAWAAWVVKLTWTVAAATFLAVVLLTFLECRPISIYWSPNTTPTTTAPGSGPGPPPPEYCVRAYAQLLTQAISNITLDLLLIVIAWPIVGLRKRTITEHVTLYTLFALGTFCIIVSVIRVVYVHSSGSSQVIRSLWASVQMLVSTFVANVPSIYGSIRALRTKRSLMPKSTTVGYDYGPTAARNNDNIKPRPSRTVRDSWWGLEDGLYATSTIDPQSNIPPLPRPTAFYNNQTAAVPYFHTSPLEGDGLPRERSFETSETELSSK